MYKTGKHPCPCRTYILGGEADNRKCIIPKCIIHRYSWFEGYIADGM